MYNKYILLVTQNLKENIWFLIFKKRFYDKIKNKSD